MTPNYPACYLLIKKDDCLLFVLRENTGYMDGMYSLPAGRVEEGETFLNGAVREAKEEAGLVVKPTDLQHVHTQHRFSELSEKQQWVDVFFEASVWSGEPVNNEPDKHARIEWLPISSLPDNIMDYQKNALQSIFAGRIYGEFGF